MILEFLMISIEKEILFILMKSNLQFLFGAFYYPAYEIYNYYTVVKILLSVSLFHPS